ncbi:MAG TPA: hypothetical protein VF476_03905 [Chitinophagaceae bacterium]
MLHKSATLTILGFAGFIFSCFTFFFTCSKSKPGIHEIGYDPRVVARQILTDKRDSIAIEIEKSNTKYDSLKKIKGDTSRGKKIDSITTKLKKDSVLFEKILVYYRKIDSDSSVTKNADKYLQADLNLNLLTTYDKWLSSVKRDSISSSKKDAVSSPKRDSTSPSKKDSLSSFRQDSISINFTFYDPDLKIGEIHKPIKLPVQRFSGDLDFFTRYPAFGFWALCIIIFGCCLFMTVGLSIDSGKDLERLVPAGCTSSSPYWKSLILCFVLLAAFVFTTYKTFYDGETIKDLYFMNDLQTKVKWLSILGYAGAAFCFAGMISSASKAACMKKEVDDFNAQLQLQAEITAIIDKLTIALAAETDPVKQASINTDITNNKIKLAASQALTTTGVKATTKYEQFRQLFKRFFYGISLLLALLVFCTGALYSACDTVDFIRMIKSDMGFSPVRHDFVYLYSGLHTLLILLFYLPAQLIINNHKPEETTIPITATTNTTSQPPPGILTGLKNQVKGLGNVLIAGAPLVASFVQWLLSIVLGE